MTIKKQIKKENTIYNIIKTKIIKKLIKNIKNKKEFNKKRRIYIIVKLINI